jgi:hypothetical protein
LQAAALKQGLNGMAAWVMKARQVNHYLNTDIMPWELMKVPVEWLDAIDAVMGGLPKVQDWQNQVEAAREDLKRRTSRNKVQ